MKTDVRLGVYNAFLLGLAPLLLAKKALKFRVRGHAHEWDLSRWNAPASVKTFVDEAVSPVSSPNAFVDEAVFDKRENPNHERELGANVPEALAHVLGSSVSRKIRVVLVALSWGEVGVLNQISARLERARPNVEIVWSIRERAAQEQARAAFPGREIVPMPFDFALPVGRWLEVVKPDVLVVVEKFWWPNLVWGARNSGARVVLINGRSRGRERARYRLMSPFQRWVLGAFHTLCFESDAQIERVREVLPRHANVVATGNVKFGFERAAPPRGVDEVELWLQSRTHDENGPLPLLVAGSTASEDEALVLEAWKLLRAKTPCALLIAPRRVERADSLVDETQKHTSRVSRRSQGQSGAEVLVLDSMGELGYVYRFARAAYVGGALSGRGHNILEPIAWGVGVAYGPNRGDFESAQRAAEEFDVGARVRSADELVAFWRRALVDESEDVARRCAALLNANQGALERVIEVLNAECGIR